MSRKPRQYENFDLMVELGILQENGKPAWHWAHSESEGFMNLVVERRKMLDHIMPEKNVFGVSLTHYFSQNGDQCKDPDMEVIVMPSSKRVFAQSFEQSIPPVYQVVFDNDGSGMYRPKLLKQLDGFLNDWLRNLKQQGHGKNWTDMQKETG